MGGDSTAIQTLPALKDSSRFKYRGYFVFRFYVGVPVKYTAFYKFKTHTSPSNACLALVTFSISIGEV